nr:hypothetical protein CFP56_52243 [Quercus suber]
MVSVTNHRSPGDGLYEPPRDDDPDHDLKRTDSPRADDDADTVLRFAPSGTVTRASRRPLLAPINTTSTPPASQLSQLHDAWSTAVNSRLRRVENARFLEHFRYIIVASQLLNEYLDQGSLQPLSAPTELLDDAALVTATTSLYGAFATAVVAFALVYIIHWTRGSRTGFVSKSRIALAIAVFTIVAIVSYAYLRRQWLKFLRRNAVTAVSNLTSSWPALEITASSALSFIQEVELVSKGYRLSTPLPPASRIEEQGPSRRCGRLRKALHKAYATAIPTCIDAYSSLKTLVDEDDIDRYFEVYDINAEDVREASGDDALTVLDDDPESLKSLRLLSYKESVLRRAVLCALMAIEADGGKPDFSKWRTATQVMQTINTCIAGSAGKLQTMLDELDAVALPTTPGKTGGGPAKEKLRGQVRKISMLSTGIRSLQAKMQILREETNRSLEQSEDLTDLGPSLMAQYESIGVDLRDLTQAWEAGKLSLQSNISKHERRISLASSGLRSPVSSLGGLTAVDEDNSSASDDAVRTLSSGTLSNRSSMATNPSDIEEIFEAIAMPKQRSTLTREERLLKMQDERERQAALRAKRESSTTMLRELESVINLRPGNATRTRANSRAAVPPP